MMSADATMNRVAVTISHQRNTLSAIRRLSHYTAITLLSQHGEPSRPEQQKPTSFIASETVAQTLHGYEKNNIYLFLRSKFGAEETLRLMKDYRVGISKHWPDHACSGRPISTVVFAPER